MYAAFTAVLPVIHMPGASAPEPGASGASLYQSTFASPDLRPALRSSESLPPSPLPSPGLAGSSVALPPEGVGLSLFSATGFLSPPPPLVAAHTVPPTTSNPATAAAITSAGRPLKGLGAAARRWRRGELRRRVAVTGLLTVRPGLLRLTVGAGLRLTVRARLLRLLRIAVGARLLRLRIAVAGLGRDRGAEAAGRWLWRLVRRRSVTAGRRLFGRLSHQRLPLVH